MSRAPAKFTEAELRRAAKVAMAHGVSVDILPNGTIRISPPVSAMPGPQELTVFADRPPLVF